MSSHVRLRELSEQLEALPEMGTRWGRTSAAAATGLGCLGLLGYLVLGHLHALTPSVVVQSGSAQFSSTGLIGTDVGLGVVPVTRSDGSVGGTNVVNALRAGLAQVKLNGLCLSQTQSVPGFGDVTFRMTSGDGDPSTYEISGTNLLLDVDSLTAAGPMGVRLDGQVQAGVTSNSVTTTQTNGIPDDNPLNAPDGSPGYGAGWYGIDADYGRMFNVRGSVHDAFIGGTVGLPLLSIHVVAGEHGCNDGSPPPALPQ